MAARRAVGEIVKKGIGCPSRGMAYALEMRSGEEKKKALKMTGRLLALLPGETPNQGGSRRKRKPSAMVRCAPDCGFAELRGKISPRAKRRG
jgi:hypothetical protein